jgi:hypothetical protein
MTSNDSNNSPIAPAPRGRPGPGGDGGEGGGPGPGPGVGPGGGRGPRGGGRPPGWAWGAHDIDPETGKLIAPMEPIPQVRYMGDPASDAIFALNASWGPARFPGRSWWSYGHEVLDGLGLIPVIGEIADVANGIWYAVEGEWGYAGISFIAVVPVVGDAGKVAKYGHKIVHVTHYGRMTDKYGNVIGASGELVVHTVKSPTRKGAKDAARNAGNGAPVHHPNHFHSTKDGKKIPNSPHYEHP